MTGVALSMVQENVLLGGVPTGVQFSSFACTLPPSACDQKFSSGYLSDVGSMATGVMSSHVQVLLFILAVFRNCDPFQRTRNWLSVPETGSNSPRSSGMLTMFPSVRSFRVCFLSFPPETRTW